MSYYTGNNYEICSNRLKPSLEKFNLPYYIKEIQDSGNYHHNISFKPEFVRECLAKYRKCVCWLDVDCEIKEYPELLFNNADNINLQIYNWYADADNHITRKKADILSQIQNFLTEDNIPQNKLLSSSGVFVFNYSKESLELLDAWIKEMKKNPNSVDDQTLDRIFNDGNWIKKLKCRWLPKSYNRMSWYSDWINYKPIINHTKANICALKN